MSHAYCRVCGTRGSANVCPQCGNTQLQWVPDADDTRVHTPVPSIDSTLYRPGPRPTQQPYSQPTPPLPPGDFYPPTSGSDGPQGQGPRQFYSQQQYPPVPTNPYRSSSAKQPPRKNLTPLIVTLAVLLVVGLIAIVVIFNSGKRAHPTPYPSQTSGATVPEATPRLPDATPTGPSAERPETTTLRAGQWIAVLESLPKASYTADNVRANQARFPGAIVVDSDVTPGLNGGYWVIAGGPYASEAHARASCASFGRSPGGTCYPRQAR